MNKSALSRDERRKLRHEAKAIQRPCQQRGLWGVNTLKKGIRLRFAYTGLYLRHAKVKHG